MARLYLAVCFLSLVAFGVVDSASLRFKRDAKEPFSLGKLSCGECDAAVFLFKTIIGTNPSHPQVINAAITVCKLLKIEEDRVCVGIVNVFAPEFFAVLKHVKDTTEVCSFLVGPSCGDPYNPNNNWNITLPNVPQPKPVYPVPPKKTSPRMRFIQLSDIHFDNNYKVGSVADCKEPLCCRDGDGGANGAGKFGDYRNCDIPIWTLENLFAHLASKKDTFDYIIWTGDLPAHNVWNQSRTDQTNVISQLTDLLLKYLPGKPVYPCLGNHESSPVNSFPPAFVKGNDSISWLYDSLAESWQHWLPKDAIETVKWGGYYTVSPYAGFRIISINMNYCNNQNFWLMLNATDPNGELQWLAKTLQAAEDNNEKVHILGHIPPGNGDCLKPWSWNYYKIISRYQNTIAGQFFGHDHPDSFEMFYDVETLKIPISVGYLGPSVTTYSNLNPGYRVYEADGKYKGSSFQILDHETYIMNLTKANLEGNITWEFEYSAKTAYNMTGAYPKDWDDMINRMTKDYSLIQLYNKHYHKSVDNGTCDASCRSWLPCQARSGRSYDPSLCKDLGLGTKEAHVAALKEKKKHC